MKALVIKVMMTGLRLLHCFDISVALCLFRPAHFFECSVVSLIISYFVVLSLFVSQGLRSCRSVLDEAHQVEHRSDGVHFKCRYVSGQQISSAVREGKEGSPVVWATHTAH